MRLMQHKQEAYWFYRFLSIFYDKYVNPLFWTEAMRDQSLRLAKLDDPKLKVIDVGSGTGFTTQGIVQYIPPTQVTCVDQSPHQMAKARAKADLQGCTFIIGDAENIPQPDNTFDRYVSAGSIEYWPNPQKGIEEAYRVIKPGGRALLIGPLEPGSWISRFFARLWMLFPKDREYREWFERAGFEQVEAVYVQPHWHRSKTNKYGIAIAGVKPQNPRPIASGQGSVETPPAEEKMGLLRRLLLIGRVIIGSIGGFIFIPIALLGYLYSALTGNAQQGLNRHQTTALVLILIALALLLLWLLR